MTSVPIGIFAAQDVKAMPTFVAAGTAQGGTGALTVPAPAGIQNNDILLLLVETRPDQTVAAPSGYAEVTGSPQLTTLTSGTQMSVFWKRTNGTESDITVADSGDHQVAQILAFRGCVTSGNPWDVSGGAIQDTATTSVSISGMTTTVANTLVVVCCASGTDTATAQFSSWANASLSNVTEQVDSFFAAGGGFSCMTGGKATAGATGTSTATLATSARHAWVQLALKP